MSGKHCSRHVMEISWNGPQWPIQYSGLNVPQSDNVWGVLLILWWLGTHPLLLFDIAEANYLLPPPDLPLSTTDLIAWWVITLQKWREHLTELHRKVHTARLKAAIQFEKDHGHTIHGYNFKSGDLVLIRNTAIEKALNQKMWAHYLGPLIVMSHNKGGAYIITKLDGSVFDRLVAAFRVIPYFARTSIMIPPLDELLDISWSCLIQMEQSTSEDPEEEDDNYASEDEVLADDWGQSRVKLGGGMGQQHVWTLFFGFHFSIFFLFTFWTIIHLLRLQGLLSRYTLHNFYRLVQSFRARAMNKSEPWPQNSKYFQQKQKIFIVTFIYFLKILKKKKKRTRRTILFSKFYRYRATYYFSWHNNKNSDKKQEDKIFH